MTRRNFIKSVFVASLGLSGIAGLYSWQIEPFRLEYVRLKMPIQNLPKELAGKTLMQISDIHVGNRFDYNFIIDSFKNAQVYDPDFVVYTGDYVSYESPEQFEQLNVVMQYAVKGNLGTVGILGNHDYGKSWSDQLVADKIALQLKNVGIDLLSNQQLEISGLNFIGFDDFWGLNFAPETVMSNLNNSKANIVLCHNPDVCDLNIWNGYQGWILAGHTHGGQCKPPFF